MSEGLSETFRRWIAESASEGLTLEFKSGKLLERENLKRSGRHQLTKAVASMANTEGGLVAIGIAEAPAERGWSAAASIELAPSDWTRDRVLQWLKDNVSPPIEKLDAEVERTDDGVLILIHVPLSFLGHQNRLKDGEGGEYRTRRANGVSEPLDGREVRQLLLRSQLPDPVLELTETRGSWFLLLTTRAAVIDRYRITLWWDGFESDVQLPDFKTSATLPSFGRSEGKVTFREARDALIFPGVHQQVTYANLRFDGGNSHHNLASLVQVPGVPARLFAWDVDGSKLVAEPQTEAWWSRIDLRDPLGLPIPHERAPQPPGGASS
ncbi:MAG: ATP-binding protein [Chloroflexi bacterium]|nr:ATP-binding protein [Chloroflexota bacterium]